jgi:hypothetical protein
VVYESWGSSKYYNFVAVTGIVVCALIIILYVLQIPKKFDNIPWNFVEMVYSAIWAILMLIAAAIITSLARAYAAMESYSAAAFFGFLVFIIYTVDSIIRFVRLLRGGHRRSDSAGAAGAGTAQSTQP